MVDVRIHLDTKEVKDALQALRREGPKAIADAMNRVGFEILDAQEIEVRGAFVFSSPSTERFLARGFLFDKATPDALTLTVRQRPKAPGYIAEHVFGDLIKPDSERLSFAGKLAVPIHVKRGARGRVAKGQLPGDILASGKGFATPRAIFQRTGGKRTRGTKQSGRLAGTRLMYLLLERPVRLPKRLQFFEVFASTARKQLPLKAARVLEKLNLRRR